MLKHIPALATRAAAVATATTALALVAVLPAQAAPQAAAPRTVDLQAAAPVVAAPVVTLAAAAPAIAASPAQLRTSALTSAMSKIGSPYRWGASGPGAFDCSGLVNWAYKQVGISLPRTSRALSTVGTPVAKADLQPGDLVFFYRPVSHVAIYIGDGKVVHASTSGQPVKISDLNRMPFNTARRI